MADGKQKPQSRESKTLIGAYVDLDAVFTLQELLAKVSRERREKVTMQQFVTEALILKAEKHGLKLDIR